MTWTLANRNLINAHSIKITSIERIFIPSYIVCFVALSAGLMSRALSNWFKQFVLCCIDTLMSQGREGWVPKTYSSPPHFLMSVQIRGNSSLSLFKSYKSIKRTQKSCQNLMEFRHLQKERDSMCRKLELFLVNMQHPLQCYKFKNLDSFYNLQYRFVSCWIP